MCVYMYTEGVSWSHDKVQDEGDKRGGGAVRKRGGGAVRKEIKCNTMSAVRDAKPNGLTMGAVPGIYAF